MDFILHLCILCDKTIVFKSFLCCLRSKAAHREQFVRCLSVRLSSGRAFFAVTHSYVSQETCSFLGMLPLCLLYERP